LAVLTLSIPPDSYSPDENASSFEPIWSIFVKDDDIQVERPYTPLFGIDETGTIKLWVKKYSRGEVGRWLHSKKVGDTIEIRGPLKTFPYQLETKWDEVVMVYLHLPDLDAPLLYSDNSLTDIWRNRFFAISPVIVSTSSQKPRLNQYPLLASSRVPKSGGAPAFAPFTTSD
jgi:cytochrome-b5 reductase